MLQQSEKTAVDSVGRTCSSNAKLFHLATGQWTMRMIRMSASVVCCWCAYIRQRSRLESFFNFSMRTCLHDMEAAYIEGHSKMASTPRKSKWHTGCFRITKITMGFPGMCHLTVLIWVLHAYFQSFANTKMAYHWFIVMPANPPLQSKI